MIKSQSQYGLLGEEHFWDDAATFNQLLFSLKNDGWT